MVRRPCAFLRRKFPDNNAERCRNVSRPERERPQKPQRSDRHPQRDVSDAPDSHSFHEGNMPAFLMRSVKVG